MATLLRGKNKGKEVEISQWCNDWVTIMDDMRGCKVVSPSALQYTLNEFKEIMSHKNNGILLGLFEPDIANLRFKKIKRKKEIFNG